MTDNAPATPGPLDRCVYNGAVMDEKTAAFVRVLERRLGYPLTITQGCYSTRVAASGNTHAGGGVVDLAPWDHANKVRHARDLGAAAWYRAELWRDGKRVWPAHIHLVIIGHQTLSDEARTQVVRYLSGLDGLAGGRVDPNPYRPDPEPPLFSYRKAIRDEKIRARRVTLQARIKGLRDRISAGRNRITYR